MGELNPDKLHVTFLPGASAAGLDFPRRYTLTHSDFTGDLFLTIGSEYDHQQIRGLYTRLMRDEVLAEWTNEGHRAVLHVYVHVSGGLVFGTAGFRNDILHHHMPMVLEALRYGDRGLFAAHPQLENAPVQVHFAARQSRFNKMEEWGQIRRYKP